jgi:hypothetical protein
MKQEMKNVGFSAPLTMRVELEERADQMGVSKSSLIKMVLSEWIEKQYESEGM